MDGWLGGVMEGGLWRQLDCKNGRPSRVDSPARMNPSCWAACTTLPRPARNSQSAVS